MIATEKWNVEQLWKYNIAPSPFFMRVLWPALHVQPFIDPLHIILYAIYNIDDVIHWNNPRSYNLCIFEKIKNTATCILSAISVQWLEVVWEITAFSRFCEVNSWYWSWACCQIFLCLDRHANEAKGSIQCRIDAFAPFACQTADNCDKSYYEVHLDTNG